jgi:hypothetical protein
MRVLDHSSGRLLGLWEDRWDYYDFLFSDLLNSEDLDWSRLFREFL